MRIDIPTVMLALVVGFLLLALQLSVAQRSALRLPELRIWSRGCWALLGGFVMLPARVVIPEWVSVLGGNCLLLIGISHFNAALYRHLLDRPLPVWLRAAAFASCLVVLASLDRTMAQRTALYSLLFLLLMVPALLLLIRDGWPQGGSIRAAAVTMTGAGLAVLMRCGDAIAQAE